jgi:hypothetical protein
MIIVTTQVQSSGFTVQWLFAEPLTVKRGFFMSQLRSLGMDKGSWLVTTQVVRFTVSCLGLFIFLEHVGWHLICYPIRWGIKPHPT